MSSTFHKLATTLFAPAYKKPHVNATSPSAASSLPRALLQALSVTNSVPSSFPPHLDNKSPSLKKPKSSKYKELPYGKPDLDKLERAPMDALTELVYEDDGRIVDKKVGKRYCTDHPDGKCGVMIKVYQWHVQFQLKGY